jgi:hypothetical protein
MEEKVLNLFLRVGENFSEIKDRVSLLKTYLELNVFSPGIAMRLEEFEKILGFKPELIYRSEKEIYGISVIYTIDDEVTTGIIAHEFAELVARESCISSHEAIDRICVEKGFGKELLLALHNVFSGRVERSFINGEDLKRRVKMLRSRLGKS